MASNTLIVIMWTETKPDRKLAMPPIMIAGILASLNIVISLNFVVVIFYSYSICKNSRHGKIPEAKKSAESAKKRPNLDET